MPWIQELLHERRLRRLNRRLRRFAIEAAEAELAAEISPVASQALERSRSNRRLARRAVGASAALLAGAGIYAAGQSQGEQTRTQAPQRPVIEGPEVPGGEVKVVAAPRLVLAQSQGSAAGGTALIFVPQSDAANPKTATHRVVVSADEAGRSKMWLSVESDANEAPISVRAQIGTLVIESSAFQDVEANEPGKKRREFIFDTRELPDADRIRGSIELRRGNGVTERADFKVDTKDNTRSGLYRAMVGLI